MCLFVFLGLVLALFGAIFGSDKVFELGLFVMGLFGLLALMMSGRR